MHAYRSLVNLLNAPTPHFICWVLHNLSKRCHLYTGNRFLEVFALRFGVSASVEMAGVSPGPHSARLVKPVRIGAWHCPSDGTFSDSCLLYILK